MSVGADLTKMAGVTPAPKGPGFIIAAGQDTIKVADQVVLTRDVSSVHTFTVGDGAAAADLLLAGGLAESGGACGLVKDGPGTMQITGELDLSGYITVYDGTLDLSGAKPGSAVKVNLLGDAVLVPPAGDARVSAIHVNGGKLAPGRWGPPGSVAAGTAQWESRALGGATTVPDSGPSRREIWKKLKYGIFSHYVWNGYGMTAGIPNADGSFAQSIDELAELFDVDNYVEGAVESRGPVCGFHGLALGHLSALSQCRDGQMGSGQAELSAARPARRSA